MLENEKKYMPGDDFGETTEKPKLLLHSCCGPCSSYVLEYLTQYFYIKLFFYNPNIQPAEEYNKRLEEQKKIIDRMKVWIL